MIITLISATVTVDESETPRALQASDFHRGPKRKQRVTPQLTASRGWEQRDEGVFPLVPQELSRGPVQQGGRGCPLSLPFYLRTHSGAHRVLRRSGLPRVTWRPGVPGAAAIHSLPGRAARGAGAADALNPSLGASVRAGGARRPRC